MPSLTHSLNVRQSRLLIIPAQPFSRLRRDVLVQPRDAG